MPIRTQFVASMQRQEALEVASLKARLVEADERTCHKVAAMKKEVEDLRSGKE